jgi:hypothetical protein
VVSAKYATGEVDYILSRSFTLFSSYAYQIQLSNNPQVFGGITNFGSAGIRWNPNGRLVGR